MDFIMENRKRPREDLAQQFVGGNPGLIPNSGPGYGSVQLGSVQNVGVPPGGMGGMGMGMGGGGMPNQQVSAAHHAHAVHMHSLAVPVPQSSPNTVSVSGQNLSPEDYTSQMSIRKDRAIANYYKRLSLNTDIYFYMEILNQEGVGEAVKRNLKNKMNTLLLKKIEDRYDDL